MALKKKKKKKEMVALGFELVLARQPLPPEPYP
jgi:hypothetical protein